jgi:hypothetical protein
MVLPPGECRAYYRSTAIMITEGSTKQSSVTTATPSLASNYIINLGPKGYGIIVMPLLSDLTQILHIYV